MAEKTNDNILIDSELEKVTGGNDLGKTATVGKRHFSNRVDMYAGTIGESYYIVDDDEDEYFYGVLMDTWEAPQIFGTERTHVFRCTEHNGSACSITREFSGDDYTLYTVME